MAKTADDIVKAQFGELLYQNALLLAENSALKDRIAELEAKLPKDAPAS